MSSPDRRGSLSRGVAVALLVASTSMLGGCFRPLYGPTASGVSLRDALASVEVEKANSPEGQERLGHFVRSELIFDIDGSGQTHEKRYKLSIDTAESVQAASVNLTTGFADVAILNGTVKFVLKNQAGATVLAGTVRNNASYQRDRQRFASVRAARDADIRVAELIADEIKQRISAYLATAP